MPEVISHQRSDEWLAARRGKITASLAAACLGADPYRSRIAAWREIMGLGTTVTNRAMQWGIDWEPHARLDYEAETGNLVELCGFFVHPDLPWLGASPDGEIDADGLLEIKCPGKCPTRVPVHHRIQCQVQLAVTGRRWVDYFAWSYTGERFLSRVHRSGIPNLICLLHRFYQEFVVTGIQPSRIRRRKVKRHDNKTLHDRQHIRENAWIRGPEDEDAGIPALDGHEDEVYQPEGH